ncbi:UDP-glucose 4-epimerase GalE [Candidatus Collierbacteria bacterium RIFOXYB2_FULL_46_14]|nr:MAG: UDP-glucose 4-epimerase GalE [Candidatus Collierbacteria bacterium RIFOXYB2_FULL_46_14]OGD76713.1 MAG: UDP-glucose 4-epimerase GalE [Candidatus Collierbacteria bacterium RIFOXYA2_FULL_46_20]OGD78049.1 MAG: UDP-glucose 4-epimerase GalE [Candidatus Collierbacteria bacterium RIFOXYC2_FULL_43_15]OGD81247.1 MAG: UDP-glucose 4-epimerase GalE [Pseudomonadales bacterium GWC2_63_15]OGD82771.1 MAG: UDP-glucose 4-epimerase GalE [Candidatus Collierbacteria bacterium RIFOXYD2_FULL_45_13]
MKHLVIGGAGYIGGVCVEKLIERGDAVVVLDHLGTGHRENVHPNAIFIQGEKGDSKLLDKIFSEHKIDTVLDFAGLIQVGESVKKPSKYFQNNFCQGVSLLDSMRRNGVDKIIFSSTAAVFGNPKTVPITEEADKSPINPYGESKYFFELAIKRYAEAYDLKYTIFRYFNACGATIMSKEQHINESHLIPLIFQAVKGERANIAVFGTDYETTDGTCIRDYVHIEDLISAHLAAIKYMEKSFRNEFNLGNGSGYSVKEVINAVEKITGKKVPVVFADRREGDPARLIASSEKAKKELGWSPKYPKIEQIIESAWSAELR